MGEHTQLVMWMTGIVGSALMGVFSIAFYILGLKVLAATKEFKAELASTSNQINLRIADIQKEIGEKMSTSQASTSVMGEQVRTLQVRMEHMEKEISRLERGQERMRIQITRILAAICPDVKQGVVRGLAAAVAEEEGAGV